MDTRSWPISNKLIFNLFISSVIGAILLAICSLISHTIVFSYLLWNLFLAWIPIFLSMRLVYILRYKKWSSYEAMILSFIWLLFLPNSFYMISDYIHLQTAPSNDIVYYAVAFTSIIYTAVVIGFISLRMIHKELEKRFRRIDVSIIASLIIGINSLAIYIGRDLRLSSWAILTNPGGLIFDISDRIIHVSDYPGIIATVGFFFILLSSIYFLALRSIKLITNKQI